MTLHAPLFLSRTDFLHLLVALLTQRLLNIKIVVSDFYLDLCPPEVNFISNFRASCPAVGVEKMGIEQAAGK